MRYNIYRQFQHGNAILKRSNVSREEALLHCNSKQTSSSTCTIPKLKLIEEAHGPWFDCMEEASKKYHPMHELHHNIVNMLPYSTGKCF